MEQQMRHNWYVKSGILPFFGKGKDLEIRIRNGYPSKVVVGDTLNIHNSFEREVIAIRSYPNFEAMLLQEEARRIHPGMDSEILLIRLRTLFLPHQEKKGVLVFELIPVDPPH